MLKVEIALFCLDCIHVVDGVDHEANLGVERKYKCGDDEEDLTDTTYVSDDREKSHDLSGLVLLNCVKCDPFVVQIIIFIVFKISNMCFPQLIK